MFGLPRAAVLATSVAALTGCGAIATSPSWAGGGLATTGPLRPPATPAVTATAAAPKGKHSQEIAARHILVMHADSQARPDGVTRSREQALATARECLQKIRAGADFEAMVREYSDEPGAAERGGDLGVFTREVMVERFAKAAFSLRVGEVSEVVETPYGFHIIQRTR